MDRGFPSIESESVIERAPERHLAPWRAPEECDLSRERHAVRDRTRAWQLSDAECALLYDVGRFRTVAVRDLLEHRYRGNLRAVRDDLRSLTAQGLILRRSARTRIGGEKLDVLVLTKPAKNLLERVLLVRDGQSGQAVYAGFVKPSEVAHDAAIYRMFHAESARLRSAGARVNRVVLDYELKRKVYGPLAKARRVSPAELARRQTAVARETGLSIVRGRFVLPDLRIEYETRDGSHARVDLELATEHYHGSHLAQKAEAGFTFYVADGSGERLSRLMEEREIIATILSL